MDIFRKNGKSLEGGRYLDMEGQAKAKPPVIKEYLMFGRVPGGDGKQRPAP